MEMALKNDIARSARPRLKGKAYQMDLTGPDMRISLPVGREGECTPRDARHKLRGVARILEVTYPVEISGPIGGDDADFVYLKITAAE